MRFKFTELTPQVQDRDDQPMDDFLVGPLSGIRAEILTSDLQRLG